VQLLTQATNADYRPDDVEGIAGYRVRFRVLNGHCRNLRFTRSDVSPCADFELYVLRRPNALGGNSPDRRKKTPPIERLVAPDILVNDQVIALTAAPKCCRPGDVFSLRRWQLKISDMNFLVGPRHSDL
jgi:multidrug efflux pump